MHYFEMKKKSKILWGGGIAKAPKGWSVAWGGGYTPGHTPFHYSCLVHTPPPQSLRRLDPHCFFDKSNTGEDFN